MTDGMISADDFADALSALGEAPQVSVVSETDVTHISVDRGTIFIKVTVAPSVWEWFVDISADGQALQSDWTDYAGYGESRVPVLDDHMYGDILAFLRSALTKPLRIARQSEASLAETARALVTHRAPKRSKQRGTLEWKTGDVWEEAHLMRDDPSAEVS